MKPKIFIYDWKETKNYYREISDVVDVKVSFNLPDSWEGYAGMIFHNLCVDSQTVDYINKQEKHDIPLIFQVADKTLADVVEANKERMHLDPSKVHWVLTYGELFRKVRELFGRD